MRKLVKNKLGLSLVEVIVSLGITGVVGMVSSVPVIDFQKRSQKTTATQAFVSVESDIFYHLANNNACEASLMGVNSAVATALPAIRRAIPLSAGGGFENILVVGQPIHPLVPHLIAFDIRTQPLVATGLRQGLIQINFDFRSAAVPALNKVRPFIVKVFTDPAGLVIGCTRGTIQDLTILCRAFNGTLNATGRCENLNLLGANDFANNVNVNANLSGAALTANGINISSNLIAQNYNVTTSIAVTGATTGASSLGISGPFTSNNFVSTNLVCASGGNCRSFAPVNCGIGAYVQMIHANGAVACNPRPW